MVTVILLSLVVQASPCSWAIGYFYQVTQLRGKVVGAKLSVLQNAAWLRRSFARRNAKLTLYSYRWPIKALSEMPLVKATEADGGGNFDFGALSNGHYNLIIDDPAWGSSDTFEVEIKNLEHQTESVTIDVSPVHPDCKGGHEFIVNTK